MKFNRRKLVSKWRQCTVIRLTIFLMRHVSLGGIFKLEKTFKLLSGQNFLDTVTLN